MTPGPKVPPPNFDLLLFLSTNFKGLARNKKCDFFSQTRRTEYYKFHIIFDFNDYYYKLMILGPRESASIFLYLFIFMVLYLSSHTKNFTGPLEILQKTCLRAAWPITSGCSVMLGPD